MKQFQKLHMDVREFVGWPTAVRQERSDLFHSRTKKTGSQTLVRHIRNDGRKALEHLSCHHRRRLGGQNRQKTSMYGMHHSTHHDRQSSEWCQPILVAKSPTKKRALTYHSPGMWCAACHAYRREAESYFWVNCPLWVREPANLAFHPSRVSEWIADADAWIIGWRPSNGRPGLFVCRSKSVGAGLDCSL